MTVGGGRWCVGSPTNKTNQRTNERTKSPSFVVRRSPFAVRRSPFAVRRSPFAVRRSSFVVRRSSFVVRRSSVHFVDFVRLCAVSETALASLVTQYVSVCPPTHSQSAHPPTHHSLTAQLVAVNSTHSTHRIRSLTFTHIHSHSLTFTHSRPATRSRSPTPTATSQLPSSLNSLLHSLTLDYIESVKCTVVTRTCVLKVLGIVLCTA